MARVGGLVSMLSLRKRVGLPADLYRSRLGQRGISVESAQSACQRVQACVNKKCALVSFAKRADGSPQCACRRWGAACGWRCRRSACRGRIRRAIGRDTVKHRKCLVGQLVRHEQVIVVICSDSVARDTGGCKA